MARRARERQFAGISTLPPSYFKPAGLTELIDWCAIIAADMSDHGEAVGRTGVGPPVVEGKTFVAGKRMTLAGRPGDEHRANAVGAKERCLNGDNFWSDAAVSVEWRMNRGDEMMKPRNAVKPG